MMPMLSFHRVLGGWLLDLFELVLPASLAWIATWSLVLGAVGFMGCWVMCSGLPGSDEGDR